MTLDCEGVDGPSPRILPRDDGPKLLQGRGASAGEVVDVISTVARADGAAGWCVMIGATTGLLAGALEPEWAERIYGADPRVVTGGVTAPMGRAERVGGGWRVTGRWRRPGRCM